MQAAPRPSASTKYPARLARAVSQSQVFRFRTVR
jgi:hypothetical protein